MKRGLQKYLILVVLVKIILGLITSFQLYPLFTQSQQKLGQEIKLANHQGREGDQQKLVKLAKYYLDIYVVSTIMNGTYAPWVNIWFVTSASYSLVASMASIWYWYEEAKATREPKRHTSTVSRKPGIRTFPSSHPQLDASSLRQNKFFTRIILYV